MRRERIRLHELVRASGRAIRMRSVVSLAASTACFAEASGTHMSAAHVFFAARHQ